MTDARADAAQIDLGATSAWIARQLADRLPEIIGREVRLLAQGLLPPPLPVVRRDCLRSRHLRRTHFAPLRFADPYWDILFDIFSAGDTGLISVSSACIAAGVPPTTALRKIRHLESGGWLEAFDDPFDARRRYLRLTPKSQSAFASYHAALGARAA